MNFSLFLLSVEERNLLLTKLGEELGLRKYSPQTVKAYSNIIENLLASEKSPRDFLLQYTSKSSSSIRLVYFALQFFFEKVLHQPFDEHIPLAKQSSKLPSVLNKEEVNQLFSVTYNLKHRLVLILLYYSGMRLHELINLCWEDFDFQRGTRAKNEH